MTVMSMAIGLGGLLGFVLLARACLVEFSRSRLEKYCAPRRPERLGEVLAHDDATLVALRWWTWLLLLGLVVCLWPRPLQAPGEGWERFALAWLSLAALDLWVLGPLASLVAEPVIYWTWPLLGLFRLLVWPLAKVEALVRAICRFLAGQAAQGTATIEEELLSVVNEGEREGTIQEDAAEMIEGLIDLPRTAVSEIMTPRTEMVMLKSTASVEEARSIICEHGHSRIPVFGKDRDDVLGILYAKDLLPNLAGGTRDPGNLAAIELRRPVDVQENKPVDVLLREFQKERVHIAIVRDDYGGVAGLVTIEDILEEIVGEIADEHDPDEPSRIHRIDEREFLVDAKVPIEELNEELHLDLPEDPDYETVGGFIFNVLGYVPKRGETVRHGHLTFTIMSANERTINRVRIVMDSAAADASQPQDHQVTGPTSSGG